MTDDEINKRIHELLGMCQHEYKPYNHKGIYACSYCADLEKFSKVNIDFTTSWEGFGILVEWWKKHEKFRKFMEEECQGSCEITDNYDDTASQELYVAIKYVSPRALVEATVRFFKEEQK